MKKIVLLVLLLAIAACAWLLLTPSPISNVQAWQVPAAPELSGVLAPNDDLRQTTLLANGQLQGPEDITVDTEGRIYGGTLDGKIMRLMADGKLETFADTGGRPLGLHFDRLGNLIVADAMKGLLSIAADGVITVLSTEADGIPFKFADDLDIASDGTIYFSDASSKYGYDDVLLDLLEANPNGRLLAYDPRTKQTRTLLDGLYFANGIAVSTNEDFVLVNETYRYRVTRYWLKGPKAGQSDIFIDNLPGFPDGISSNGKGRFWLALFTIRNDQADELHASPWLKSVIVKLPDSLRPHPEPYGFVMALDEQGAIQQTLQDVGGEKVQGITSVEEQDGYLWLGNLEQHWIGRLPVPTK